MGVLLAAALLATIATGSVLAFAGYRRRERMRDGVHELRRPLQILALAAERGLEPGAATELLEQARGALIALEHELARRRAAGILARGGLVPVGSPEAVSKQSLADEARRRWQGAVEVEVAGACPDRRGEVVSVHRGQFEAALDNLIANAAEHGGRGPVTIGWERARDPGRAVLRVVNGGRLPASGGGRGGERLDGGLRGRGLRVASAQAMQAGVTLLRPETRGGRVESGLEVMQPGDGGRSA